MQIQLLSGAYQARSIIASAQRCLNLYPEIAQRETFLYMPQPAGAASILTHYPTPGLTSLAASTGTWRCLYMASNGTLYGVCGQTVYAISSTWGLAALGTLSFPSNNPVSMADNAVTLVIVDGSTTGYTITLATNAFAVLADPTGSFVGADFVEYLDTFFLFNKPNTQIFYTSLSNSTTFDPLYFAAKVGGSDRLVAMRVVNRNIWLLGAQTSEVWYDSGASAFPFQITEGAFIQHGCHAKYSVASNDLQIFWLGQDPQGQNIVFMGNGYTAARISTHAIEHDIQSYSRTDDAIGYCYQQEGHVFYVLNFPTADRTWVYDQASNLWHERAWIDSNGVEHRHRSNVYASAYGAAVVGDWSNGSLYAFDLNNYTDNGQPIKRLRAFPHVVNDLKRVVYHKFIADMQAGGQTDPTQAAPLVGLRWSDDRGNSWGNYITQPLGAVGNALANIQWRRLGMARDRVFELSWSSPVLTALNSAYIDVTGSAS